MMKILLVHPQISPEHEWVTALKQLGHAVLASDQEKEAWQILQLHGESIDLVVIHREGVGGRGEPGLELVKKIKRASDFLDLPYILTSAFMDLNDFAQHQKTPLGANAYLRAPFDKVALVTIVQAVLPQDQTKLTTPSKANLPPTDGLTKVVIKEKLPSTQFTVEEATFTSSPSGLTPSIQLDLGHLSAPDPSPMSSGIADVVVIGDEPQIDFAEPEINFSGQETKVFKSSRAEDLASEIEPQFESTIEPPFDLEPDAEAAESMPYVYSKKEEPVPQAQAPHPVFTQPIDDSIVPGGASGNTDVETLKKYLQFREQDVAVLSNQLKETRQQLDEVNQTLRLERAMINELKHTIEEQGRRIEGFETERRVLIEGFSKEADDLRFQMKGKADRARLLEAQVHEAVGEVERIKERVRIDIRKIRTREKELENRLEIIQRDGEALLTLRESKIADLKRKMDLLEFNMDLLQNRFEREKTQNKKLREQFERASQVVKVAGGLLEMKETAENSASDSSIGEGHGSSKAAS